MYLVIDEHYRIYKAKVLSGYLRSQARQGNLSIVRLRDMKGMNSSEFGLEIGEEWSDIQDYEKGAEAA